MLTKNIYEKQFSKQNTFSKKRDIIFVGLFILSTYMESYIIVCTTILPHGGLKESDMTLQPNNNNHHFASASKSTWLMLVSQ